MKKIIVYGETERAARKFYPGKEGEAVGHRAAKSFKDPEKCDMVLYAGKYPEIEAAYAGKKETPKK